MFVDFAGATVPVLVDRADRAVRAARRIFVACLGASSYTYVEATWGQTTADWVARRRNALNFSAARRVLIVPDNPKAAIAKACFYEPAVQRTYADFAAHYAIGVLPARPRKPRDKAKAETGVQVAQRWIVARLRNQRFHSLAELNAAIADAGRRSQPAAHAPAEHHARRTHSSLKLALRYAPLSLRLLSFPSGLLPRSDTNP